MPISLSHIVDALSSLGGEAHLDQIEKRVREIAPPPIPNSAAAIIRGRLQNFSSDTSSFTGQVDLFESVHGVAARRGIWRLRSNPKIKNGNDNIEDGAEAFVSAEEGLAKLRLHLVRERSRKLIDTFKASLQNPKCEACGMSFDEQYGVFGRKYIEAHHKIPVSQLKEGEVTKLADLAALCANCHRVIHANSPLTVEELAHHLKYVVGRAPG